MNIISLFNFDILRYSHIELTQHESWPPYIRKVNMEKIYIFRSFQLYCNRGSWKKTEIAKTIKNLFQLTIVIFLRLLKTMRTFYRKLWIEANYRSQINCILVYFRFFTRLKVTPFIFCLKTPGQTPLIYTPNISV